MDDTYWTGYPNAATAPYTDPVPNWANTKYMMVKLKPTASTSAASASSPDQARGGAEGPALTWPHRRDGRSRPASARRGIAAMPSMNGYAVYLLRRLGQFALVVFIGINIAFIVTHATPIDPVEQTIAAATQFGSTSPEAIAMMRQSLRELYGLEGGLWRAVRRRSGSASRVGDFGPSLSAFPTPVSVLIGRALPWTVGAAGRLDAARLGARQPARRAGRLLPPATASCASPASLAMAFHPIPYYIVAFVLLIVFGYLWPVLPISGGYQMNMRAAGAGRSSAACCRHAHPAGAVAGAGRARRLVHGHALAGLQHRHRGLRHLCRARRREPRPHPRAPT